MRSGVVHRWACVVVGASTVVGLAACGSAKVSDTPRVTVREAASDEALLLLTESDVRGIDGLSDAVAKNFNDIPVFENPDPRGPCGAVAPQLPLDDAVGRSFSSASLVVFEILVPDDAAQRDYLASLLADRTEGCPDYQSQTNLGITQTVSDVHFVDITDATTTSIAWTSTIEVLGRQGFGGLVVLEVNGRMAFIQMQGIAPLSDDLMKSVATAALAKLVGWSSFWANPARVGIQ